MLHTFFSIHSVKEDICRKLVAEAELNLGFAMTFTLIEWAKEHLEELLAHQPATLETCVTDDISNLELEDKVTRLDGHYSFFNQSQKRLKIDLSNNNFNISG